MRKSLLIAFLIALMISGLAFEYNLNFGLAQSGTNESGIISSDTTWTQANSPYTLTADVLVSNGVTLTIEAGTTVNMNYGYLEVNGTLQAIGNNASPIIFNGGQIAFDQYSNGWNQQGQSGSIIKNCNLNDSGINIVLCSPMIQNSNISGQISIVGGSTIISNNNISSPVQWSPIFGYQERECEFGLSGNNNVTISGNVISGDFDHAAIDLLGGSPIIESNLFECNSGLFLHGSSSSIIMNNTFASGGTVITSDDAGSVMDTIIYNNFENNANNSVFWAATANLNVTYNWWGTTDTQAINQTIYDSKDNFHFGTVSFVPFLTAPNPQAPNPNASVSTPAPTSTQSPSASPTTTSSSITTSTPTSSTSPNSSPSISQSQQPIASLTVELIVAVMLIVIIVVAIGAFLLGKRTGRKYPR